MICVKNFYMKLKIKKKNINDQVFRQYFHYQSPSFLLQDLHEDNQNKNNIIVKYLNESLINLKNFINSKEIPDNEYPKKC